MTLTLRDIRQSDAEAFAELIVQLTRETPFTLFTEQEARAAAASQAERTRQLIASPLQAIYLALDEEKIVGFIGLTRGAMAKNRHVCSLMMGVRKTHQRQGIGSRLLQQGLEWTMEQDVQRVELGVLAANAPAIALYEKFAFAREGTRTGAIRDGETWHDEIIMAKLLSSLS